MLIFGMRSFQPPAATTRRKTLRAVRLTLALLGTGVA
jgi:hypothetical protein